MQKKRQRISELYKQIQLTFDNMDFHYPLPNIKKIAESYYDTYLMWLEKFVDNEISEYESVFRLFPKKGWENAKLMNTCKEEREWLKYAYKKIKLKWREHYVKKTRKHVKAESRTDGTGAIEQFTEHLAVCSKSDVPNEKSN